MTWLEAFDLAERQSYEVPLTQKLIADTLRRLRVDRLAVLVDQRVTTKGRQALGDLVDFDASYFLAFPERNCFDDRLW